MSQTFKALTDEELVKCIVAGNDSAFEELYQRYSERIYKLLYSYVYNEDDAIDLMHDVFIRAYRHIHKFDVTRTFSSWLYKIAINCAKNHRYKVHKTDTMIEKEEHRLMNAQGVKTPEDYVIDDEISREFSLAIDTLSDKFKEVFLLRVGQQLQYSDIASILNISERTAKWRMERAIMYITDYLKKRGVL
ncbi:MAG: RNA polymerase sigma factor [Spirochaetes bacterium]|nr:RNA polymerase sigma factor [Spirochaetota bacterium]